MHLTLLGIVAQQPKYFQIKQVLRAIVVMFSMLPIANTKRCKLHHVECQARLEFPYDVLAKTLHDDPRPVTFKGVMDYALPVLRTDPLCRFRRGRLISYRRASSAAPGQPSAMRSCGKQGLSRFARRGLQACSVRYGTGPTAPGSTLHEAGGKLRFAYFPIAGIVSLCV